MRTTTAGQDTALAALDRASFVWVEVQDGDDDWRDLTDLEGTDWVDEVQINANEDDPISQATITLRREVEGVSIAPLIEGSPANTDDASAYAPLINAGRGVRVYVATELPGVSKATALANRILLWRGTIDDPAWGGARSQLRFTARDPGAALNDTIIETVRTYGDDDSPVDVQTVMQSILTDNAANIGESITLVTVGDPDFGIRAYELGNVSVLEALMELASLNGWSLRYLWNEAASDFRLTFYEPLRSGASPIHTLGPDDYYDVQTIGLSRNNIRNAGELVYTDTNGAEQTVTDTRSTSITDFGRRFIRLDERGSSIQTSTQADAMLDAVLDDLSTPAIVQAIECAFFWPVELGDMYTWTQNGVHYDTDQDYAVFGYTHVLNASTVRTTIQAAGQPAGGFRRWLAREAIVNARDISITSAGAVNANASGTQVTYAWTCSAAVSEVWLFARTITQPATIADVMASVEQGEYLVSVLTPDSDRLVQFTFDTPDEGSTLYGAARAYHVMDGKYTAGNGDDFHIDPRPGSQPVIDSDDTETATTGYFWIRIQERGIAVTSVTMATQSGRSAAVVGQTPTRDEGDTSIVTGAVMGAGEYEAEVALADRPSWIGFDITLSTGEVLRVNSPSFDEGATPNFIGNPWVFEGQTLIRNITGDSDTHSFKVERTDGVATWLVERDGRSGQVDVGDADDAANPGITGDTSAIYTVTLRSDPTADVDGNTLEAEYIVTVTIGAGSGEAQWTTADYTVPTVGSDEITLTLHASASTDVLSVTYRYRLDAGAWTSPATMTPTTPSLPSAPPTTESEYVFATGLSRIAKDTSQPVVTFEVTANMSDVTLGGDADTEVITHSWYTAGA